MKRLIGRPLPDLQFMATSGRVLSPANVAGLAVLYMYPYSGRPGVPDPPNWDDIPGAHGSTPQAAGFKQYHLDFRASGIAVFGLSGQSPEWQAEFATRMALPFALLSDQPLALAKALSLPTFETGGVAYLQRLTVVSRDGVIDDVVYPVPDPASHAAELLRRLVPAQRQ